MPYKKYDEPKCCDKAFMLIYWMPKGPQRDGEPGPEKEGWSTFIEAGGPGVRSTNYNVIACPFCGTDLRKLTNDETAIEPHRKIRVK